MIKTKRVYETPDPKDGYRVFVERLWPRGLTREAAAIDEWLKDIAPSPVLRRDYKTESLAWQQFTERYRAELAAPEAAAVLADLRRRSRSGTVTLLYAKKDPVENSAAILRDVLEH